MGLLDSDCQWEKHMPDALKDYSYHGHYRKSNS